MDGIETRSHHINKCSFQILGQCFANPLLCDQGLTFTAKVKLDDVAKTYTTPHYIIDTGGSNGQGFSLYTQNSLLFAEAAFNNKLWRVSHLFFF